MRTIVKYRKWCKNCQDFTVHNYKDDKYICDFCDTIYTDVYLKDIPKSKIEEQRQRYTEKEGDEYSKLFGELAKTPEEKNLEFMMDMFSPPGSKIEIIESDAGLNNIRKREREKRLKERAEYEEQKGKDLEEIKKYKGLNRNDICACGSGKKYKKCCLNNITQLRNKYRV